MKFIRMSVSMMASSTACLRRLFRWRPPQTAMHHPTLKDLDLYPDMTKTSETHSLGSSEGKSVRSVLQSICFYLREALRKVLHRCMRVTENIKRFFLGTRETDVMPGKNRTLEIEDPPEGQTWNNKIEMSNISEKTVDPQKKEMIQSDHQAVSGVLLSDWLECQSEEQDEGDDGSDSETEWSEEEDWSDDSVSEMSSENGALCESFLNNGDPYNPLRISCFTEDKPKGSDNLHLDCEDGDDDYGKHVPSCPQEKDETEWSEEEDSDWSDEGDLEMSAESRKLWESFNSDPYDLLCFSCPIGGKKASENQPNDTPSCPTASDAEEDKCDQSTKERTKKVRFSEEVTIHNLEAWDGESQAARDGSCWMELARDGERFKRRVEKTGEIISWCLTVQHRTRVFDERVKHSQRAF